MPRRDRVLQLVAVVLLLLGCQEELVHDLDEQSANRVQLALLHAGLRAEKTRSGEAWSIAVDSKNLTEALAVVEATRVLRREKRRAPESSLSLLMSREEREQLNLRSSTLSLERTLEGLPEVLEARVHVRATGVGERGGVVAESASVVVAAGREVVGAVEEIRTIASGALGIPPERLKVVLRIEQFQNRAESPPKSVGAPAPWWWPSLLGIGATLVVLIGVRTVFAKSFLKAKRDTSVAHKERQRSGIAPSWTEAELEADAF